MVLADNKVKIQALLAGINALPEAGSGETPDPVLQEKEVIPTKEAQSVTPDTGFDGLSKVDVAAIPDEYIVPSGTVSVTKNGEHDVREAAKVNVAVPIPEFETQEKSVTPTTSKQTVTPDAAYDGLSKVTVNAMPTATQATPSIEVNDAGLITATSEQAAGYVTGGKTSATKQLPTQGARTITPGTTDKTIEAGKYLTGMQTIKGDANLIAGNIKSGVSIFGVAGSLTAGEGGGATLTYKRISPNNHDTKNGIATFDLNDLGFDTSNKQLIVLVADGMSNESNMATFLKEDNTWHDLACTDMYENVSDGVFALYEGEDEHNFGYIWSSAECYAI